MDASRRSLYRGWPLLLHKHQREAIAAQIKADVDEFCRVHYDDGFRTHLGASLIGHDCNRFLWYTFRWVMSGQFGGRMQRLFNRGHETEPRFIFWLESIGFKIWAVDEQGNQFRVTGVEQHFGGSMDGVTLFPERYRIEGPFLLEFKTYKDDLFKKLVKAGSVKKEKPQHFAQMSTYGKKNGFKYALYCAINKNDDDLYFEVVELDWKLGEELERRAEHVITAKIPPPRISEDPTNYKCKTCSFWEVCHRGAAYARNCRSCDNAVPVKGAKWFCTKFGAEIPDEVIRVGCDSWHPVGRQ